MSLKARALRFLSQREHSRFELRRKLVRYEEDIAVIDELLSALEKDGWLSTRRFVESVVHRRASVFGVRRIAQELSEHRVPSDEAGDSLAALRQTEFERALALWQRRFDSAPTSLQEKAKQHRFLAARGFDGATIAQVLRHASSDTL